jgi:hypothetical protein
MIKDFAHSCRGAVRVVWVVYLIYSHLTKKQLRQAVIGIHAAVAIVAFLLLLFSGIQGRA